MRSSNFYAVAASISSVSAVFQGFNYGSTYTDGSAVTQSGFESLFTTAKGLVGTSNAFTSARLYTMVQAGTSDGVTQAIPAAINTGTSLLLGLWGSAGQANFNNELSALKAAISTYGTDFTSLIAGISIGSEDLYRNSPIGIINKSGIGADPAVLVSYISQVKSLIAGTSAASAPIGHVDTWTAWVNGSNDAVIQACDFLGMDAYPYFQNTIDNGIDVGNATFFEAYDNTIGNSFGKPVWITETGWPVSGPTENLAVASLANARTYWEQVACTVLGNINTWWYTLQDSYPDAPPPPSFGIVGSILSTTPLYDLSCPSKSSSSTSSTSTKSLVPSSSAVQATFSASSASLISTDLSLIGTATATPVVLSSHTPAASATVSSHSGSVVTSSASHSTVVASAPVTMTRVGTTMTTITTEASHTSATKSAASQATSTSAAPAVGSCSTDILSGDYQYPHLIVPVSSAEPTTAFGTSYFGEVSSTVTSIFNFDIPASYAGKTCSLVFLFPTQAQLTTSSYTISGAGGFAVKLLSGLATEATTYDNVPAASALSTTIPSITPGNNYVIFNDKCGAGRSISFEVSATGDLGLKYFQDYSPSPIGLYVSSC